MRAYRSERTGSGITDAGFWDLRFESDVVPDSDKPSLVSEFTFESDAVPDGDEPGMLFFESILLPEGCFFLCAENGDFRKTKVHFLRFPPAVPAFPDGFLSCFVCFLLILSLQKAGFSGEM